MKTKFKPHQAGEANGCQMLIYLVVGGLALSVVISMCEGGGSRGGSQHSTRKKAEYCKYPGCTDPPSEFWEAGTGYCHRHAQQLRDEQKLLDKVKKQGF
ncbi:MAG: hypothetical protein SFY92_03200 [Verrucomicrobiae bacterium]|nr:hypothetical protein [Verrucomicrobiae bacterium]